MKLVKIHSRQMNKILNRNHVNKKRVRERVYKIIQDVAALGDEAVIKYTRKFDKVKLSARQLKVTGSEISAAYQGISPKFASMLKVIIDNITRFYTKQLKKSWKMRLEDGISLGEIVSPLEKVGIYVPAGTNPLISTVYMSVIPAKVAGVKNIIIATPPGKDGFPDPHILAVANLLKVDEIYKIGGAQAIAALALGTRTVPKVDKIIGPGNIFVSEAKRQVFGNCDVDMIAGPTELVIIANQFSNLDYVACDLEAQSEHSGGISILVTPSKKLAKLMRKRVEKGYIVLVKNMNQAVEVVNKIAPEHLEIMVKNPQKIIKGIKNAGAIFIGPYSPVAVGDYIAGPSHILPTAGTARFFSGLSIDDFIKKTHVINYTKKGLEKAREPLEKIAGLEGLSKHVESIQVRFK